MAISLIAGKEMGKVLEQLKFSSSKLIGCCAVVFAATICVSACHSVESRSTARQKQAPPPESALTASQKDKTGWRRPRPYPAEAVPLDEKQCPGTDIECLLQQLRRAGPAEAGAAEIALTDYAPRFVIENNWNMAVKSYGEAMIFKPSTVAIIGLARAMMMIPTKRATKQETLAAKSRWFQEAVLHYRLALEFSERANELLKPEEKAKVQEQIVCLETFMQNPDLTSAQVCPSVREALKQSGLD